jgi:glycosyltransferase involved in cell wall biosynthesis
MKLIIQIPCYNEETTLPITIAELPRQLDGIDSIEILVINDGSNDNTVKVAQDLGVDYVVSHKVNKGLAATFQTGILTALEHGADIIVNTDADNQYPGRYIADLVRPIVAGQADMVIGDRQTHMIAHFSPVKKALQNWGSAVVRYVSKTDVPDAPSGFRAISREAALRLNVFTDYTYTLETIIQIGYLNLTIAHVPITTNSKMRESRLIKNIPVYVFRSASTILRLFMLYKPLRSFFLLSLSFFTPGVLLWLRYYWLYITGIAVRGSNVQSIILGAVFIILGFLTLLLGFLGELIAVNRRLNEEILYRLKKQSLSNRNVDDLTANNYRNQEHENLKAYPE